MWATNERFLAANSVFIVSLLIKNQWISPILVGTIDWRATLVRVG